MKTLPAIAAISLLLFSCAVKNRQAPLITYTVKATFPHDSTAFTQGLAMYGGRIFESTGKKRSYIAEVDPVSGKHIMKVQLGKQYFGEGIAILNHKLYQLTWKNKTGFIYTLDTFNKTGQFSYSGKGWGLTHNNQCLIMSDGSHRLYFLDTLQYKVIKTLPVLHINKKIKRLNELEYYKGYILANQWRKPFIWQIDPQTGKVTGRLDLSAIVSEIKRTYPRANVLNGIAYNVLTDELLITGKYWPAAYLLRIEKE